MHIAFKPKETLTEFADSFHVVGQQLIMTNHLKAHRAYTACAQVLKINQILCLHFKAHKAMFTSIKSIKLLLQGIHPTHSDSVVWGSQSAVSGTNSCTPQSGSQAWVEASEDASGDLPGQLGETTTI
ncbi:hypothetical protein DSO57_1003072 [Entomophthora muscae]|uniref:Uncharacterized protein n=1 Tax=Entomophthora muscae TaxID=34485 RepID=A0ACC2TJE1_9FUNG|nr:hypothetical protein DSO57_1003072 [Entomophthora muscae]